MAVCVTAAAFGGGLSVSSTPIGQCTAYVILTASDYAASSPSLTLDDTLSICAGIMTAWALAYGIKLLRRSL